MSPNVAEVKKNCFWKS